MKANILSTMVLAIFVGALALVTSDRTDAMPGWSDSGHPSVSIDSQQREQISRLHGAYRAALAELDWSIGENGHAAETMRQARELRMALRAEISDVLNRDGETAGSANKGACPYSGKTTPVRFDDNAPTIYL